MSVGVDPAGRLRLRARPRSAGGSAQTVADRVLQGLCVLAVLVVLATMAEIAFQVLSGAHLAFSKFGLGFLGKIDWKPNFLVFGAGVVVFGTVVSSAMALLIAVPLGVGIGLYLSMLAPRAIRTVVGPMVEMLAAVPSVIVGFWGLIVLAPYVQKHVEPLLHNALGFLPIFGPPQSSGLSLFTGGLVLTLMVLPIVASLSRDLFLTVPGELKDGAAALGATRWEVIQGVVLPTTAPGVMAAALLGLGRALGEAIAISEVVGGGVGIHGSLFVTGDTLASRIANQFPGAYNAPYKSALFYLAAILLVIGLLTNFLAQRISRRFQYQIGAVAR